MLDIADDTGRIVTLPITITHRLASAAPRPSDLHRARKNKADSLFRVESLRPGRVWRSLFALVKTKIDLVELATRHFQ